MATTPAEPQTRTSLVLQAVQLLTGRDQDQAEEQNGIGWNGSDTHRGHRLAERPWERWTPSMKAEAVELLRKYRRQLAGAGIDYDALVREYEAEASRPTGPRSRFAPAQRDGRCSVCRQPFAAGDQIGFRKAGERYDRYHATCEPDSASAAMLDPNGASQAQPGSLTPPAAPFEDDAPHPAHGGYGGLADGSHEYVRVFAADTRRLTGGTGGAAEPAQTPITRPRQPATTTAAAAGASRAVLGPEGPIARSLPGYEPREPQLRLADLIDQAISEARHAALEAGTGTGKSLAYLVAALQSGKKAIVATSSIALQDQLWRKDLPFLQATLEQPFAAALLKGRSNYVCLQQVAEIKRKLAPGSMLLPEAAFIDPDDALAWPALLDWLGRTEDGDLSQADFRLPGTLQGQVTVSSEECTGQKCPVYGECHIERAKARARAADVIVVNYHLLLRDLVLREATGGHVCVIPLPEPRVPRVDAESDEDPAVVAERLRAARPIVILDEAHNLEDIATDSLGSELTLSKWGRQLRRLEGLTTKHADVRAAGDEWKDLAAAYVKGVTQAAEALSRAFDDITNRMLRVNVATQRLGDETLLFRGALELAERAAKGVRDQTPVWLTDDQRESWKKLATQMGTFVNNLVVTVTPATDALRDVIVRYAELETQGEGSRRVRVLNLCAKPIDVAPELKELLWDRFPSVIACSATIATGGGEQPMAHWRERVGCEDAIELVVDSPFDFPRNALLYLPEDGRAFDPSAFRQEGSVEYLDRMAHQVERLLLASNGRAFVLFTSFRALDAVYERLAPRLTWQVMRQGEGIGKAEMVRRFKEDGHSVIFATRSFWEGVDVQGEALSLVVIDKLPFAVPDDPIFEARCEALKRRHGDEWAHWNRLVIPGVIIALKQGFGRLIRTRTDRGVVALMDGRLTTKGYGSRVLKALPPATRTRSLEAVATFFSQGGAASEQRYGPLI